jgi:RimJ/RimL family protein N-acetyltransferase
MIIHKNENSRVYLRPMRPTDIDDRYVSWFADDMVTRWLGARNITKKQALDFLEEGNQTKGWFSYAVCDHESDQHIGNVKIGPIKYNDMTSDLVTVIGAREFWGRGLASEAIAIGSKVAFEVHNIRKLNGGMFASNKASIKAYCRAGWFIEAYLPRHYKVNDHYEDRVVVSGLNPAFFPMEAIKRRNPPGALIGSLGEFILRGFSVVSLPDEFGTPPLNAASYEYRLESLPDEVRIVTLMPQENPFNVYASELRGNWNLEHLHSLATAFQISLLSVIDGYQLVAGRSYNIGKSEILEFRFSE